MLITLPPYAGVRYMVNGKYITAFELTYLRTRKRNSLPPYTHRLVNKLISTVKRVATNERTKKLLKRGLSYLATEVLERVIDTIIDLF